MAWNKHDQQLDAQTKIQIAMPNWQEHKVSMYNMTKHMTW